MEALHQVIQANSDTLVLKIPDTLVNQVLEIVVLPMNPLNSEISQNSTPATMQQICLELAEFHQRFDSSQVFTDSVILVREDRE